MDIRKIQKTGGSSYIVSLPKDWADQNGIKEKVKVGIIKRKDGTLVITKISSEINQKEKEINIDTIEENSLLFRLLVASYFQGYGIIRVTSEKRLDPEVREIVKNFKSDGIGLEIMEETPNSLTIKDLLNPAEIDFKQWLVRIRNLVVEQIRDSLESLKNKDAEIAEGVIMRDREVNRINWLLSRQHKIVTSNVHLTDSYEAKHPSVANYSAISRIIERMGDHAVNISKNSRMLSEKEVDAKILKTIVEVGKDAIKLFENSIDAFFGNDLRDANTNIDRLVDFLQKCKDLENLAYKQESAVALSIGYISESIRRIGEYSADLAEYVINHIISTF